MPRNQYNRKKEKLKKQKINVIFNNSELVLTPAMESVLTRGLKFAILPQKLDITQVLTDFRRFERSMVWKEFWFGRDSDNSYEKPLFNKKKHNFPRNYRSPKGLQDCLAAVKCDIMDPHNRNRVKSNLSQEEKEALKQL